MRRTVQPTCAAREEDRRENMMKKAVRSGEEETENKEEDEKGYVARRDDSNVRFQQREQFEVEVSNEVLKFLAPTSSLPLWVSLPAVLRQAPAFGDMTKHRAVKRISSYLLIFLRHFDIFIQTSST